MLVLLLLYTMYYSAQELLNQKTKCNRLKVFYTDNTSFRSYQIQAYRCQPHLEHFLIHPFNIRYFFNNLAFICKYTGSNFTVFKLTLSHVNPLPTRYSTQLYVYQVNTTGFPNKHGNLMMTSVSSLFQPSRIISFNITLQYHS